MKTINNYLNNFKINIKNFYLIMMKNLNIIYKNQINFCNNLIKDQIVDRMMNKKNNQGNF